MAIAASASLMAELGHIVGTFLLILVSLAGTAFLIRRFLPHLSGRSLARGDLQPLALLTLTPQCSVALVQAGQETLVLGLTSHAVTLLTKANGLGGTPSSGKTQVTIGARDGGER